MFDLAVRSGGADYLTAWLATVAACELVAPSSYLLLPRCEALAAQHEHHLSKITAGRLVIGTRWFQESQAIRLVVRMSRKACGCGLDPT